MVLSVNAYLFLVTNRFEGIGLGIEKVIRQALVAHQSSNHAEVLRLVARNRRPGVTLPASLYELAARSAAALGDLQSAIEDVCSAINNGGATLERVMFYGDLLLRCGKLQAAADVFQQVIRQKDDCSQAWKGLAHCLFRSGDFSRAYSAYSAVLEREEGDFECKAYMGFCMLKTDSAAKASVLLHQALQDGSGRTEWSVWLGEALRRSGRVEEAIPLFEEALKDPSQEELAARLLLASWISIEDYSQIESILMPLLEVNPGDPELLTIQARWLAVEGDRNGAIDTLKKVVHQNPDYYTAWSPLLDAVKEPLEPDFETQLFEALDRAVKNADKRSLAGLHFAVARQCQLKGDYQSEMESLILGNQLMAELSPFDAVLHRNNVRTVRKVYTGDVITSANQYEDDCFSPVFILSLPRSGSTLLEQALARHPLCCGAAEANFASAAWHRLKNNWSLTDFPELHKGISREEISEYREFFLRECSGFGIEAGKVMIHKGINNHKIAGLLASAFPRARFIELRRNPLDVAYGCFKQNFEFQHFSFSLTGIASEMALFNENMLWWQDQIPDRLEKTSYESLISDFEAELRRILQWLGLPWDDDCLDFQRASRVGTASLNQVREGLFKTAVNRIDQYGSNFDLFVDALAKYGVDV